MATWAHIHGLAERVGAGETAAWPELMAALEPKLQVLARYQKIGRLRSRDEDLRNVVVAVFDKLERRDHEALRRFAAMAGRPSFEAWIRRVLRSVAIDYLRGHAEYRRTPGAGEAGQWVSLATLSSGDTASQLVAGVDSGMARRREVLRALAATVAACKDAAGNAATIAAIAGRLRIDELHVRRVAERGPRMHDVVELLFAGHRHDSIADLLGLSRREVELAVKHAEELLVARWRDGGFDGDPDDRPDQPDRPDRPAPPAPRDRV